MRDLLLDLAAGGGIHRSRTLRELGHSRRQLARAVAERDALRPRIGWMAHPDSDPAGLRAVALGGRLTGSALLENLDIWVDAELDGLLVACAPDAARLPPLRHGERRIWRRDRFPDAGGPEWRVSVLDALRDLGANASPNALIASVDSALHHGLITQSEVVALTAALPARHRQLPSRVDPKAEAGSESHLRLSLRSLGLSVRSQVKLVGVGRVDLVVDGWLIIEADSRAHHGRAEDQDRDRQRDGEATLRGYATLRFMAMDVRNRPEWCLAVITARLRAGRPAVAVRRTGTHG